MLNTFKEKDEYIKLMNAVKEQNLETMNVENSNYYSLGKKIFSIKKNLLNFSVKNTIRKFKIKLSDKEYPTLNKFIPNEKPNYFSDKKIVVYTSIYGGYDTVAEPLFKPNNCTFKIFTDQDISSDSIWEKVDIKDYVNLKDFNSMDNVLKNRFVKICPHIFFKDYEYSIYIDGNIKVISDLTEYINDLEQFNISMHRHFKRNCVYDEVKSCLAYGKITKKQFSDFNNYLLKLEIKKHIGLFECGIIVRNHNNNKCINLMEKWWDEFKNNPFKIRRDQLLFIVALAKANIDINFVKIIGENIYTNPSFKISLHK